MRIPTPIAVFVGVLLGGLVLPFAVQRERPAKAAFEYVAPPGFTPAAGEARRKLTQGTTPVSEEDQHPDRKAWVGTPKSPLEPAPRIVLVHNPMRQALDDGTLTKIAAEMSEHQRSQGLDWSLDKVRVVERNDGARIGFVTWDVETAPESSQPKTPPRRAVQLSFPDDTGISIVTAQYVATDDATLTPLLEASIQEARGVAIRPAPLALWIRLLAAALLGFLGFAVARWSQRVSLPQTS